MYHSIFQKDSSIISIKYVIFLFPIKILSMRKHNIPFDMGKSLGRYMWHFNINLNEHLGGASLGVLGGASLGGLDGKEFAFNDGDLNSIPGSGINPLEKVMVTHSRILAWRILWTEESGGLQPMRVGHDWATDTFTSLSLLHFSGKEPVCQWDLKDAGSIPGLGASSGGGHGNPPQYFCLEKPMHRGAWQAIVHRVAKSQTQ